MALESKIKFAIPDGALVRRTVFTTESRMPIRSIKKAGRDLSDRGLFSIRGNLSSRCGNGFIITSTGANLASLSDEDFVQVDAFNSESNALEKAFGLKTPSSETPMHSLIYAARNDVNAIIHSHDPKLISEKAVAKLKLPVTPSAAEPGTQQAAQEAADLIAKCDAVVSRGHGIVVVGKSVDVCAEKLITLKRRAP